VQLKPREVFAVVPCPFVHVCPSVCHVGGNYCQASFRPDCPIIRIFDLQHRYPIPREPLLRGKVFPWNWVPAGEGVKILWQWENSVIFD